MKSWIQKSSGPFHENLVLEQSQPLPQISASDQILVQNFACCINPVDHKRGTQFSKVCPFPSSSGCDGAGIVLAVGDGVNEETICKPGDFIYYHTSIFQPYGTFSTHSIALAAGVCRFPNQDQLKKQMLDQKQAESSSVNYENNNSNKKSTSNNVDDDEESFHSPIPTDQLFSTPFRKTMMRGAAVPCCLWTSALALWEHGLNIHKGEIVFIRGAAGGTGSFAVQLAVRAGCTVIATCSTKNVDFVKYLGAHHVVDYSKAGCDVAAETLKFISASSSTENKKQAVDKYLDCVSSPPDQSMKEMLKVISFNGHAAFLLPVSVKSIKDGGDVDTTADDLFAKNVHLHSVLWGGFMTNELTKHLAKDIVTRCNDLVFGQDEPSSSSPSLYVPISEYWKFDGIPEAIEMNQKGRTRGKAVVSI